MDSFLFGTFLFGVYLVKLLYHSWSILSNSFPNCTNLHSDQPLMRVSLLHIQHLVFSVCVISFYPVWWVCRGSSVFFLLIFWSYFIYSGYKMIFGLYILWELFYQSLNGIFWWTVLNFNIILLSFFSFIISAFLMLSMKILPTSRSGRSRNFSLKAVLCTFHI